MSSITARIKPASGFSHIVHTVLLALLPTLVFILVSLNFATWVPGSIILLSKWRMLAVKPRHWLANIRANAVDITVGLSLLLFMTHSGSQAFQLVWAICYALWLIFLKPRSDLLSVSAQALVAQTLGLSAIFLNWGDAPIYTLVVLVWAVCYVSARHFFTSFDEPLGRFLSGVWGYFATALAWLLAHWLIFYGVVSQPTLLLSVIAFSLASIYYLEKTDRLSLMLRRQLVFVMIAVVVIVIAFSGWGDKTV